jgi:hypothetical protein
MFGKNFHLKQILERNCFGIWRHGLVRVLSRSVSRKTKSFIRTLLKITGTAKQPRSPFLLLPLHGLAGGMETSKGSLGFCCLTVSFSVSLLIGGLFLWLCLNLFLRISFPHSSILRRLQLLPYPANWYVVPTMTP